jgi:hypothetical protein
MRQPFVSMEAPRNQEKAPMPTQFIHSILGVLFLAMWAVIIHIAVFGPDRKSSWRGL